MSRMQKFLCAILRDATSARPQNELISRRDQEPTFINIRLTAATEDHELTKSKIRQQQSKGGKVLSVFQVVTFPNDVCYGGSKNGTCYTTSECTSKGGTSSGSCASGYGVCCIFTLGCGGSSSQNCTYFESSGTGTAGSCRAKICPCSNSICQLRLDFQTFVITGPSTATNTVTKTLNGAVNTAGNPSTVASQCLTDIFSVTSASGSSVPSICGTNSGEHMYVDSNKACNELSFQLGTTAQGVTGLATRSWSIKVTQIDCNSRAKAPAGCTQYYYGNSAGQVRSYNYNNGNGYNLANQNQKICIRKERGNCRICWTTTTNTDFAISNADAMGVINTCCSYGADGKKSNFDCVQIPSASKAADNMMIAAKGFCGGVGLVSVAGATAATICSMRTPFQLRFITDQYEQMTEVMNTPVDKGFQLNFVMTGC